MSGTVPEQGPREHQPAGPLTLAIDIGGTGIKASVLDAAGTMLVPRRKIDTPHPCPPETLIAALHDLTAPLPEADRVSIGFPGAVRDGRVLTASHLDTRLWAGFPLEERLAAAWHKPVRLLNDAEVQGFGVIAGKGIEMVLTLGTGAGTALFRNGELAPHLELAHHPVHKKATYDDYLGHAALKQVGCRRWSRRVVKVAQLLDVLVHYDMLYLGGGSAAHIALDLPERVRIVSNDAGITGGIALWQKGALRR